ncbi:CBF/Mak21 family protein (macronuclear) [Tetrahymena thermophila SB210]|uniref:CBF/Mak21 family protein n=1 Tax=Tetrahymena thermophila (strain SB210) TaxID=312017 RepID=Q24GR2_TETTS|nr:CBF/Mak21 family protein [Tetrahymena thermophila SB210]EAS06945.2 CBF/Mak21 family protein [Tetrahymena thermophila SB210]|eukprot:XP_001027187.2 CBF/Mak21 family protein [Tetrahymena thermophila SB210]
MARFNKFKPQQTNQDKKDNKNGSQNQKGQNANHQNKVENKTNKNSVQNQVNDQDENINAGENWKKAQQFKNETIFERASRVYQEFVKKELQKYKLAKADEAWMKKIMTDGTLKDKISAISIYIRDNPKTTLPAIENLMTFANTKSKKDIILSYNALKGIFLESVMPKNAELKTFQQNTKGKTNISDKDLVEYFYQHKLKEIFYRYVNSLIAQLNDNLFFFRKAMLMLLLDVVMHRQECQETILGALLNKLGDSDKKIVTILNQNLGKLLFRKGELVMPLVKEIERFVFRPNIKIQSQFYAINFLNTINFAVVADDVLKEIIKLLFILFKKMIETNEEDLLASKILSQILRGINKIFPHTKKNFEQYKQFFNEKINELYKLIHQTKSIKIRIQTLLFIFQVENQENNLTDRYYRVLYEMLIDPDVTHSSQTELFFDLLYFSLKADLDIGRVKSFVKRLLQHAIHCEPPFIITSLIFISKLLNAQPTIKTMIQQSERFFDDNEENFKDVEDSDEEENFKDADESKSMEVEEANNQEQQENENGDEQEKEITKKEQKKNYADYMGYDAFKREPRFTGCNESCLWELTVLINHNHPTVKKFTEILLSQQKPNIEYKGNPLLDFTVANFLDRFSFKNAKKKESVGMKNLKQKGKIRMSKLESALQVDDVMKMDQRKIREEEKFFLRFFQQKQKKREGIEKRQKKRDMEDFVDGNDDAEMDAFADQLAEEQLDSDFYDEDEPFSMSEDQDEDDGDMEDGEGDEYHDFDEEEDGEDQENEDFNEDEEQEDDEDIEQDFDENEELQSAEIPDNYEDSEEDEEEQLEGADEEEEDDFDEDDLGDIEDLEQDFEQDREKMGLEESDYEDDDIEDFGTLLEKAGQEDDIDDRKKFGKQIGQKVSKTKVIKKEPKAEKKPRHSKVDKKQNKKGPKKVKKQNKGGAKKNKKGKGRK